MVEPKIERRRQPRAKGADGVSVGIDAHVTGVQVKDISLSGLCFRLEYPLELMTRLIMTLVFPQERPAGHPSGMSGGIQCEGTVVRCEPALDDYGKGYEVAIFFTKLDEAGRKAVEHYVSNHS
jgi:hypothetical protein